MDYSKFHKAVYKLFKANAFDAGCSHFEPLNGTLQSKISETDLNGAFLSELHQLCKRNQWCYNITVKDNYYWFNFANVK